MQWILDDAPHFWFSNADWTKPIRSAREVLEIWQEEAAGIHRLGGLVRARAAPADHRAAGADRDARGVPRWVVGQGDVRTATCAEIAADVD